MHGGRFLGLLCLLGLGVVFLLVKGPQPPEAPSHDDARRLKSRHHDDYDYEYEYDEHLADVEKLAERMRPRQLLFSNTTSGLRGAVLETERKQFFHLHHMKTGGTSLNSVIHCATNRARQKGKINIPQGNLEECSGQYYIDCITGKNTQCTDRIEASSVMEFCAPLHQASAFGWDGAEAVTVLRHPVDRVWSMFRFRTKSCFKCLDLATIYAHIDQDTTKKLGLSEIATANCMAQLMNHETRNLLNRASLLDYKDEEEQINEAIHNLQTRFALVGITEEIVATAEMLGQVFPWLAETLSSDPDAAQCPLPHANASPKNNRCGPGNTHWDLPSHPDEHTRALILKHNQLDFKVYQAAVERFEMQKEALELREHMRRRESRNPEGNDAAI